MSTTDDSDDQIKCRKGDTPLELAAPSTRFDAASDACVRWLCRKYNTRCRTATRLDARCMQDLQNDVDACNELRWTRFAFPSEPHTPLRTDYNNENAKDWPVRVQLTDLSDDERAAKRGATSGQRTARVPLHGQHTQLTLVDVKCGRNNNDVGAGAETICDVTGSASRLGSATDTAPESSSAAASTSAHASLSLTVPSYTFTRHRVALVSTTSPLSPPSRAVIAAAMQEEKTLRPRYGGFISGPASGDQLRFVLFPQWRHGDSDAGKPQEVSHYLRGTLRLLRNQHRLVSEAATAATAAVNEDDVIARRSIHVEHSVNASGDTAPHKDDHHGTCAAFHVPQNDEQQPQLVAVTAAASSLWHNMRQWLREAVQLSVFYHLKRAQKAATTSEDGSETGTASSTVLRGVDSVAVQLWTRRPHNERRHVIDAANVERCKLLEDGVAVTLQGGSPRYANTLQVTLNTSPGSHHQRRRTPAATSAQSPPPAPLLMRDHSHDDTPPHGGDAVDVDRSDGVDRHNHNKQVALTPGGTRGRKRKRKGQMKPPFVSPVTLRETDAVRDDRIVGVVWQGNYNSATQHVLLPQWLCWWPTLQLSNAKPDTAAPLQSWLQLPRATYRATCTVSLGVEHVLRDTLYTFFGRLVSESWLQLPLWRRFELTLRQQAGLVLPLSLQPTPLVTGATTTMGGGAETVASSRAVTARAEDNRSNNNANDAIICLTSDGTEAKGTPWYYTRRWWPPSSPALSVRRAGHAYFWATQGPTWAAHLVRGFSNDYSAMHHARHWYALFSAELRRGPAAATTKKTRKKKKPSNGDVTPRKESEDGVRPDNTRTPSGSAAATGGQTAALMTMEYQGDAAGVSGDKDATSVNGCCSNSDAVADASPRQSRLMGFANACFVDTLRAAPRASLGFSFTSDRPRTTVDAFNRLVPRHFECSFSWFVAFQERTLRRGEAVAPAAGTLPWMRVSPVETFQHVRCGLTFEL